MIYIAESPTVGKLIHFIFFDIIYKAYSDFSVALFLSSFICFILNVKGEKFP